jgi:four helix bundle protein
MSTIKKFEDLDVWKKARQLNKMIYTFTNKQSFNSDLQLKSQIRRASVSISSNIAEGFERSGNKEFKQFLSIAKGSAGELRSQLYVSLDLDYLNDEEFKTGLEKSSELSRMLNGLITYLNGTTITGYKHLNNKQQS